MKAIIPTLAIAFGSLFFSEHAIVLPSEQKASRNLEIPNEDTFPNRSGIDFYVSNSNINTKYSEFSSGLFRGKLIVVSSKKIGGLGNGIDPVTNEPFKELFCLDLDNKGKLSNPLLFSRILNTKHNEGQVAFSPDESMVYFTRSQRENPENYQLFKAELQLGSSGNWINITQLTLNSAYSIEFPFVSRDGQTLYFASNKGGGHGGFDLYKAVIQADGSIGIPQNLGPGINTAGDETYPSISIDESQLYFSSNGHAGLGGMDLFISKIRNTGYDMPINLGEEVNSKYDEVALHFIDETRGFFSSNKTGGQGSFDIYNFEALPIEQTLQGIIVESSTNRPLPDSRVVLLDKSGNEISIQTTGVDAHFSFSVNAFQEYKLKIMKPGFKSDEFAFEARAEGFNKVYKQVLKLNAIVSKDVKK
ncbi:MAG: hypothetical protein HKO67_03135 [Flavobacteriaceae bacterium]|nr:hypothetical protein [Flavobacteriaceae bacterium]NNL79463.1 hypothetical protein [Flavobacteriaceae bacterium]